MDKDELSPINHDFLQGLSTYLTQNFGRGSSVGNLKILGSSIRFMHKTGLAKQCLANPRIIQLHPKALTDETSIQTSKISGRRS